MGFLDDDQAKQNRAIHGVRVLGPAASLRDVVKRERIDEVVVTTPDSAGELAAECTRLGVGVRDVGAFFRSQLDGEAQAAKVMAR